MTSNLNYPQRLNTQNKQEYHSPYTYQHTYNSGIQNHNNQNVQFRYDTQSIVQNRGNTQIRQDHLGNGAQIQFLDYDNSLKGQYYTGAQRQPMNSLNSPQKTVDNSLEPRKNTQTINNAKENKQSLFKSKIQKPTAISKDQKDHARMTLLMVLAGFGFLILIVGIFYGIILWDKNHTVQSPKTPTSPIVNLTPNTANVQVNNKADNPNPSTGGISDNDRTSELSFLDTVNGFVGLEAHLRTDSQSHKLSSHLHNRKNIN